MSETIGSSDFALIQHIIEGENIVPLLFGTSAAKNVTVSFWIRGTVTGTFGMTLLGSSDGSTFDGSYVSEFTINTANLWEHKTITVPGDTGGTWSTSTGQRGLCVRFCLSKLGSNFQKAAGSWGSNNMMTTSNQTQLVESINTDFHH